MITLRQAFNLWLAERDSTAEELFEAEQAIEQAMLQGSFMKPEDAITAIEMGSDAKTGDLTIWVCIDNGDRFMIDHTGTLYSDDGVVLKKL